jgi:lipoprotein-anchoring transpeptidase ErfK/SrfK
MTDPTASTASSRNELRRRRQRRRLTIITVAVVVILVVAAAGAFLAPRGDDSGKAATPAPSTQAAAQSTTGLSASFAAAPLRGATTKGGDIPVYATPSDTTPPVSTLTAQTEYTLPRSFLAFDQYQGWLHVFLPARPNSSTGWIKATDVAVSQPLAYEIKVNLAEHKVTLLKNGVVQFEAPAATGTDENPTPKGTFFFTDPLDLSSDPSTAYGVFAIGLSGHSDTLTEFAGSDGQIAIHGTNDPSTIGTQVSHGCVRVNNDIILKLSTLPLGTPVVIS